MSDYRTTTGEPHPISRRDKRRRRAIWLRRGLWGLAAVVVAGFAIPIRIRVAATGYVTTDAYAEVRPAAAGRVAAIMARSGDRVAEGDLLVQLDDRVEQAALDEALHAIRRAESGLVRREAELAQAERERLHRITQAELRMNHAAAALATTEQLHDQGLASGRALEDQRLALTLAQTDLENLKALDQTLGDKELDVLRRELDGLHSTAARVRAHLDTLRITAPLDGALVRYPFSPGELVIPDMVLYEVFGGDRLILKLRIPERHAVRVNPGHPLAARLRTHSGWGAGRFTGRVEEMRAVIQSDTRDAYRQAICTLDTGDRFVPPGTTAEARITIGRVPFWFWLFRGR